MKNAGESLISEYKLLKLINKMKAVDLRILVQEVKEDSVEERIGNIVIPESDSGAKKYKVLSVGEKIESVKEGDVVYTYPNAGHEFKSEGDTYRVISITDILVVL